MKQVKFVNKLPRVSAKMLNVIRSGNSQCFFRHIQRGLLKNNQSHATRRGDHVIKRGFKQSKKENETGQKRPSLSPVDQIRDRDVAGFKELIKPFAFAVGVSGLSFAGASIWQYESVRKVVRESKERGHGTFGSFYEKAGHWRNSVNTWWNSLGSGHKITCTIIGVNAAVFLLWRIPSLTHRMYTYFACSPFSSAPSLSMLGATFSHYSLFHLGANMYVLWSFSPVIASILGKEQFAAVYISAGLVSAFVSHVYKIARHSRVPSLGASGAIMAIVGMVCTHYPSSQLSIAFVDHIVPHSFSAGSAMKCLIAFDTLGVLLGWRYFDHAAHLGGMLFGLWYIHYGHKYIWSSRENLIKLWHKYRGPP